MSAYSLEVYSDEELGRMIRAAVAAGEAGDKRQVRTGGTVPHRTAMAAAFRLAGLGELSDAILLLQYVWEWVRSLFRMLFA